MIKLFSILFIYFLLTFCGVYAETPDWYDEENINNTLYIYSKGYGTSEDIAINNALNSIYIDIYNTIYDVEIPTTNLAERKIDINFSSYTVENIEKKDGDFYVLISLKRNEFLDKQISDLNLIDEIIDKKLSLIENSNDFIKVNKCNEIEHLINKINDKINIINTIDYFDDKQINKKNKQTMRICNNYKSNFNINLHLPEELLQYKTVIEENLIKNNININNRSKNVLSLELFNDNKKIQNIDFINTVITVKLFNNDNILYQTKFNYCNIKNQEISISLNKNIENFIEDITNGNIEIIPK